ncbi:hypothetical protein GUJ93_ZPchr0001g32888 [Zizania palustris]|uniref:Retrotransposon gag domain-containing protein n=1 Tax=Zizania palustris TaxID=103762 RepID=A0A8J5V010_ZIZPA|nr:hypothetical protein GUJ93_ZPchr0001g32888 [Zizania palustris]
MRRRISSGGGGTFYRSSPRAYNDFGSITGYRTRGGSNFGAVALSDDEDQVEEENASYDEEFPLHPNLQRVRFGSKFRVAKLPKYSGDSNPGEFSRSYALEIEASGGSRDTMAKCFPLTLEGIALRCIWSLRPGTIHSWDQLRKKFVNNIQGTFVAPMSTGSLFQVKQQPGETLWQYSQCFAHTKAKIKGLSASSLMMYFEEYARCEEGQIRRQAMIVPVRATNTKAYEVSPDLDRGARPAPDFRRQDSGRQDPVHRDSR